MELNLEQLINNIDNEFNNISDISLYNKENIIKILENYKCNLNELKPYIHFDLSQNYTRNLITTDNKKYALILLCWNKNKYSPIHNHPENGCFVKKNIWNN
jgi:cysteine dioxygenase